MPTAPPTQPASAPRPLPRRVVLTGPESSGKTTLAEQLAVRFDTSWVPEVARAWIADKLARSGDPCGLEDVPTVAREQLAEERRGSRMARHDLLICDTDVLTIGIWSQCFFGAIPVELHSLLPAHPEGLYLLTDIDVPWVADGIRDRPDDRDGQLALFQDRLTERGCDWVLVSGDREARLRHASEAIVTWLETMRSSAASNPQRIMPARSDP